MDYILEVVGTSKFFPNPSGTSKFFSARARTKSELNLGQLSFLLQAIFVVPVIRLSKVQGQPFRISEVEEKIRSILASDGDGNV